MSATYRGTALLVGADGGIGNAIAHRLVADGYRLVVVARDADALAALVASVEGRARAHPTDVTDEDSVRRLVDLASGDGGLHVAVNNAGRGHRPGPLHTLDDETVTRVLDVTATGTLRAMRHELGAMADGGRLVNIASSAGVDAAPGMTAYVAAKHAVVGATLTAAVDYADRGIRVNAVAPGPIASGGLAALPDDARRAVAGRTRLGRLGTPTEVADAVGWLVGPESAFVTGTVLRVDGGTTAGHA